MNSSFQNDQQKKLKAALISILSNSVLISLKLVLGVFMGSVAVLSEAIHSGLDLLASIIALFAVKKSGEPADERHPYGHGKWENVSGVAEALLILAAALYILYEALTRAFSGATIEHLGLGTAVMGLSALVNWLVSRHLFKVARQTRSVALEADAWHLRADVYTSLGVLAGLGLIAITKVTIFDSLTAMFVALLIIKSSIKLTISAMGDIFDVSLPPEEEAKIREVLSQCEGTCIGFHRLRTRKSGAVRFIDMHMVVPRDWTIEEAHRESDRIEEEIHRILPNTQVIIHVDPCSKSPDPCAICLRKNGSNGNAKK